MHNDFINLKTVKKFLIVLNVIFMIGAISVAVVACIFMLQGETLFGALLFYDFIAVCSFLVISFVIYYAAVLYNKICRLIDIRTQEIENKNQGNDNA